MIYNTGFTRNIWMFNEEEKGFGMRGVPSGYICIEVRSGQGNINVMVQNLREARTNGKYHIYLIKVNGDDTCNIQIGTILVNNKGRGQLKWSFDPVNVGGSNQNISNFNGAILLYNEGNKNTIDSQCPMSAFGKEKIRWKDAFKVKIEKELYIKNTEHQAYNTDMNNVGAIPSITEKMENQNKDNDQDLEREQDLEQDQYQERDQYQDAYDHEDYSKAQVEGEEEVEGEFEVEVEGKIEAEVEAEAEAEAEGEVEVESEEEKDKDKTYGRQKKMPDIKKLIRLLDKDFKRGDPFNSRRRDYRWWDINSPVNLVNILEQCGINIPKFFSPSVVMAYFKHRYLVAGVYFNRRRGKEYFICGIPGIFDLDESPFGELCRWVQVERNTKTQEVFGYWITYIDPYTGELLKFN